MSIDEAARLRIVGGKDWQIGGEILEDLVRKRIGEVLAQRRQGPNAGVGTARSGHHIPRWDGRHENQTVGYSRRARNGPIALAEKVERGPTDHEDDIIDVSQALDDWLDMSGWPRAALPEHDERIGRKSQLLFQRRISAGRRCGQGGNVANDVDAARLAITRLELARDFI